MPFTTLACSLFYFERIDSAGPTTYGGTAFTLTATVTGGFANRPCVPETNKKIDPCEKLNLLSVYLRCCWVLVQTSERVGVRLQYILGVGL
jgi:hypothetical protein